MNIGFWNQVGGFLGYSFDLVEERGAHVVLLFLLKTLWARWDILSSKVSNII